MVHNELQALQIVWVDTLSTPKEIIDCSSYLRVNSGVCGDVCLEESDLRLVGEVPLAPQGNCE